MFTEKLFPTGKYIHRYFALVRDCIKQFYQIWIEYLRYCLLITSDISIKMSQKNLINKCCPDFQISIIASGITIYLRFQERIHILIVVHFIFQECNWPYSKWNTHKYMLVIMDKIYPKLTIFVQIKQDRLLIVNHIDICD